MRSRFTLKEKLNELRKEKKLTYAELSEATGISSSTLQRLEYDSPDLNAPEPPRVGYQDIIVLAKFYDVSADYLLGFTDSYAFCGRYRHVFKR